MEILLITITIHSQKAFNIERFNFTISRKKEKQSEAGKAFGNVQSCDYRIFNLHEVYKKMENFKPDHSTFGGIIYYSDFNTDYSGKPSIDFGIKIKNISSVMF